MERWRFIRSALSLTLMIGGMVLLNFSTSTWQLVGLVISVGAMIYIAFVQNILTEREDSRREREADTSPKFRDPKLREIQLSSHPHIILETKGRIISGIETPEISEEIPPRITDERRREHEKMSKAIDTDSNDDVLDQVLKKLFAQKKDGELVRVRAEDEIIPKGLWD